MIHDSHCFRRRLVLWMLPNPRLRSGSSPSEYSQKLAEYPASVSFHLIPTPLCLPKLQYPTGLLSFAATENSSPQTHLEALITMVPEILSGLMMPGWWGTGLFEVGPVRRVSCSIQSAAMQRGISMENLTIGERKEGGRKEKSSQENFFPEEAFFHFIL